MKQEFIDLLDEIDRFGHQIAHTFTLNLAHNDMNLWQWASLQEALKQINLKSQEAFLIAVNLRREDLQDIQEEDVNPYLLSGAELERVAKHRIASGR